MLPDTDRIVKLLRKNSKLPLEKIAQVLAEKANEAGGKDNITVVLAHNPIAV